MQQPDIASGIIWYVVFVYSTVCHEAAHAFASYKLGDRTAYEGGQVSLDPTPHIRREPIGMVVMPIVSFFVNHWVMGWASAPYDPEWARRFPRRSAIMAMAGPVANLLLVLLASLLILAGAKAGVFHVPEKYWLDSLVVSSSGPAWEGCAKVLSILWSLNTLLFFFNLLPLPPLDGSAIPLFFLRGRSADSYQEMIAQPAMQLFGMVVALNGFWYVFHPLYGALASRLHDFM